MGNAEANLCKPPMKVHNLHGKNLKLSSDRLKASRYEGYADAMFFGSRTADRDEHIQLTVTKVTEEWNGSLRFGFTSHDPIDICNHPEGIPRFMCPDLVKRGGSFIENLNHIKLRVGDCIVFWVNSGGQMHTKVNDVIQRQQNSKLIPAKVWPVVDVYGNVVEVTFHSLNDTGTMAHSEFPEPHRYTLLRLGKFPVQVNSDSVELINRDCVRRKALSRAYAWNANPLPINCVWVLFVRDVDYAVSKHLSIAVLSYTPSGSSGSFPDTVESFSRASVFKNIYVRMLVGDELAICISETGAVMVAINGDAFDTIGVVPKNAFYWIVADLGCDIVKLNSLGMFPLTKYSLPKLPSITEKFATRLPSLSSFSPSSIESTPVVESRDEDPINLFPNGEAECVICLNSVPDSVFIPCGHICCCMLCADNLMNEHGNLTCPTCRMRIEENIKVCF